MKQGLRSTVFLLLPAFLLACSVTMAQSVKTELTLEQQDALDLLRTLARDLRREPDKLAAGRLQAQIAEELWRFDEPEARRMFRWSFETVSQPVADDLPKEEQSAYISRQASAVREVLRLFGKHDSKQAAAWLKTFMNEAPAKNATAKSDTARFDLLMQIAAGLVMSEPEHAARLALVALSGNHVPEGFGFVLFGLSNNNRNLGDELFRAAIATLRRNNFAHDPVIIVLANYLFTQEGELHSHNTLADAQLLANYYVDAAWKQPGGHGSPAPPSSASFYNTLESRALAIVSRYAPARLPELRGQMARLLSGLNAEQMRYRELFKSGLRIDWHDEPIDEQIASAEKETDVRIRDSLLNRIAHGLMHSDPDRALSTARKIDDAKLRMSVEDDVNLVRIQQFLHSDSMPEARKVAAQLNNAVFRARVLVQLAAKVRAGNKDLPQALEILSEALTAVSKGEDSPDKVQALLAAVEQFAKFDSIRAFEVLDIAFATVNRLKPDKESVASPLAKSPLSRIRTYTVINGAEMTSNNDATLESINFREVRSLVAQNYMQARLSASKLDRPLQRATYLTAVATSVLQPDTLARSKN